MHSVVGIYNTCNTGPGIETENQMAAGMAAIKINIDFFFFFFFLPY